MTKFDSDQVKTRSRRKEQTARKKAAGTSAAKSRARFPEALSFDAKYHAFTNTYRGACNVDKIDVSQQLFDLAVIAPIAKQGEFIERSVDAALQAKQSCLSPKDKIRAAMHIANLPLQTSVHIDGKHPTLSSIEKSKLQLAEAIFKYAPGNHTENAHELVGYSTEAMILLMLQQYAVESIGESGYTPIPSLFSQDKVTGGNKYNQSNWDLSLFCSSEPIDPNPTYKIQVKYMNSFYDYTDDITIVSLRELLPTSRNENAPRIPFSAIALSVGATCLGEGNHPQVKLFNTMTSNLLDTIG